MGRLLDWLISGFGALFASLLAMFGRKATVAVSAVTAALAVTSAFIICINSIVAFFSSIAPPGWIANFIGMFIPLDFGLCLGSMASAYTCRAAYDLAMVKIKLVSGAN